MPGDPEWNRVPHLGRPERLELAAGKLARPVLRGRGGSNVALLPDGKTADGYVPIVSEWDSGYLSRRHGEDFVVALRKSYNRAVIGETRARLRGSLRPAVRQGTTTKITLRF